MWSERRQKGGKKSDDETDSNSKTKCTSLVYSANALNSQGKTSAQSGISTIYVHLTQVIGTKTFEISSASQNENQEVEQETEFDPKESDTGCSCSKLQLNLL